MWFIGYSNVIITIFRILYIIYNIIMYSISNVDVFRTYCTLFSYDIMFMLKMISRSLILLYLTIMHLIVTNHCREYKTIHPFTHTNIIIHEYNNISTSFIVNESLLIFYKVYSQFYLFKTNISQITFQGYCSEDMCRIAKQYYNCRK